MTIDLTALSAHFPPSAIEWRVGSTTGDKSKGMALAYLTARDVMDRLDDVCGPANWQDRYEFHGSRTVCYLSIRIGDDWVTKADGAGDSDVEAEKGAISDALKRCAVKWGIGRYLYDLESPWVEIEPAGRSFKIKKPEMDRLARLLENKAKPSPSNVTAIVKATAKAMDANEPETYITAAGFKRSKANRLPDTDASVTLAALKDAMSFAGDKTALRAWVAKQTEKIEELPDAHYDDFKLAFIDFDTALKGKAA